MPTRTRHLWIVTGLGLFLFALSVAMFHATLVTTVPVISPPVRPQGSWVPPSPPPAPMRHIDWPRGDGEDGGELPPRA
jgi:hypothetical protein